jgi:NADH-quinone oxidoreductase subunit H
MTTFLNLEPVRILLYLVGICAFVGANAAYLVLAERKGAGRIQRRPGPNEAGWAGVLQPLADGLKLLAKQVMVPPGTDGLLYRLAPLMVMAPPLMCLVTIPFGDFLVARNINVGLLFVFSFGSINVMALMLGGWASRNKFSIMSAARVVSQNVAYEIPMLLVVITLLMITGTLDLNTIIQQQGGGFWNWNILRGIWDFSAGHIGANPLMPVTFVIFFTCMLAETNRAPFDMAEAESELVAGAFTEYGGMGFGVFFMAEYANIVVGCSLATVLFFGGWQSPIGILSAGLFGTVWFLLKTYALIFTVIWVRWTFPRTQFYNLLNLSWKILIPLSLFTLLLTGAMIKLPLVWHKLIGP